MKSRIIPMSAEGIHHWVARIYREGSAFQWVRETTVNALEAGAKRILFGIEWQAVERQHIYRRLIADDGCGMTPENLQSFFNQLGSGSKAIGGPDQNFGVGAKTSLLPWNPLGVVVISWVNGQPAMVWLQQDPSTGSYGLRCFDTMDADGNLVLDPVTAPFDDPEHGCDWRLVKPEWIESHGTVIVLIGSDTNPDTITGDPDRDEHAVHGVNKFINTRLWELPNGVQVEATVLQSDDKNNWPCAASGVPFPDSRVIVRQARGARHWIEDCKGRSGGKLGASGAVDLSNGTKAHWYLWNGDRPQVHGYAAEHGYIGILYKNELYSRTSHPVRFRALGVGSTLVKNRLWVIFEPRALTEGSSRGIFPTTDRNSLRLFSGNDGGEELPISDWETEFCDKMPQEIRDALAEERDKGATTLEDDQWMRRLMERFEARWRMPRLRAISGGSESVSGYLVPVQNRSIDGDGTTVCREPTQSSDRVAKVKAPIGSMAGPTPARRFMPKGSLPHCELRSSADFEEGPYLAIWQAKDPQYKSGLILLNRDHPILRQQVTHYQAMFANLNPLTIEREVLQVYKEVAIAKVAHSEHLRCMFPPAIIDEMREPPSLTIALIGLIGEEALINKRISSLLRRKVS